jgi:hypothetical protein
MDFAFVPGIGDKSLEHLEELLSRRPNTIATLTPQSSALSDYLSVLDNAIQTLAAGPAGNLLIGAHGEEEGNWYLALDPTAAVPAVYETIEKSTSIQIPAAVMGPLTWVRLQSCLLGDIKPLLLALKKALGNPLAVTAPRYIHAQISRYLKGIWEFMHYQFVVVGPDSGKKPLPSRDATKTAFADPANHFQLADGSSVPAPSWEAWIPPAGSLTLSPTSANKTVMPFPVLAPGFLAGGLPAVVPLEIRFHSTLEVVPAPPVESDFVPAGEDLQRDTLTDLLALRTEYQASHPYPVFKRYGHNTLADFTNGFKWTMTYSPGKTKQNSLQYIGSRYRYRLEVPITKPGTTELIFNFYPDSGTPTVNFSELNDPFNFFGRV